VPGIGDPDASVWYFPAGTKNAATQTRRRTRKRTVKAVGKRKRRFGFSAAGDSPGVLMAESSVYRFAAASPREDDVRPGLSRDFPA
jgi:hypothetical protein